MGIKKKIPKNEYAATEVVGGLILIVIAVVAFASFAPSLFPPEPDVDIPCKIIGYVNEEGNIELHHCGGESLSDYIVEVRYPNGTFIGTTTISDDCWDIGQERYPLENITDIKLTNKTIKLKVTVYVVDKDGGLELIFDGIISGNTRSYYNPYYVGNLSLVSSLRTNTSDEDLICYNKTIESNISANSYIYNWIVDSVPYYEILMPFNTQNSTSTLDYSNHDNHGIVTDATWTDQGIVGGAYLFQGSSDKIEGDLPTIFEQIEKNDFSISLWINCNDINAEWKVLMEARYDNKDFVRFFLEGTNINFGVTTDGIKYVVRTDNLSSNIWYNIVGVWDSENRIPYIYVNGNKSDIAGNRNFPFGAQDGFALGHGTSGSGGYWNGYIDEFLIVDHMLSEEQIYQNYLSQKDGNSDSSIIVSDETSEGEVWQCIITPNDGLQDDEPMESNQLLIINYLGGE